MKIEGMAASISPIDAQGFTPVQLALGVKFSGFGEAAASWFKFGFEVIPIVPNTMQPAVPVDAWRDGLSSKAIWVSAPIEF